MIEFSPLRSHPIGRVLLALALMFIVGCAGKTLQYKDDHDRIVRIDQAVESLRKSYVERDRSALEALLLPSGNLDQVQRDIHSDFDTFRDIQLEFSIERILIEGDNIDVFVHWQGQWKRDPAEVGTRQRGHGRLAWVGTQSILLREAQGDLPFGMGTRASLGGDPARGQAKP
ncbi:MAG: nuclear transport factor 2 family protein [Nitrospira sp.]|nr:nuclear transport factor 2 family protein [Nitrospira sp.]